MYSQIYRRLRRLWPRGQETYHLRQELEQTQWLSPEALRARQWDQIQRLLRHAEQNVPYYHDLFARLNITAGDIRNWDDFQALPVLTKKDINENLEALVATNLRSGALPNHTGGSTGEPTHFFVDDLFYAWYNALEQRGRSWYGVDEGNKVAWIWGASRDLYNWNLPARLKAELLQHRYLNAYHMDEATMFKFAHMLQRWQPDMIMAYTSSLMHFTQFLQAHHIDGIRPKLIETTAEPTSPAQKKLFETVFNCPVANRYGSRELGTIAYPCPQGQLHVVETRYLELLDQGKIAEPGQMGEVTITSTTQYTMPLIRYQIGDLAIAGNESCSCGRGMPIIKNLAGRSVDLLTTTDGTFCMFDPIILARRAEILRFQVFQSDRYHMEVRLVCGSPVDDVWRENLRSEFKDFFGSDLQVDIQLVDDIPLTREGKLRNVISLVKPANLVDSTMTAEYLKE